MTDIELGAQSPHPMNRPVAMIITEKNCCDECSLCWNDIFGCIKYCFCLPCKISEQGCSQSCDQCGKISAICLLQICCFPCFYFMGNRKKVTFVQPIFGDQGF